MDQFDRAQELEMAEREAAIRVARRAFGPHPSPLPVPARGIPAESGSKAARSGETGEGALKATHCEDCGEPIPEQRRKALPGVTLCVECKKIFEKQGKKK